MSGLGVPPGKEGLTNVAGTAAEIERHLRTRIQQDTFPVPNMPRAVVKALETMRRPDSSMSAVAQALAEDPLLAARVVRVANSARFSGLGNVSNLLQAISRLGSREVQRLLMEAAVRTLFHSSDKRIVQACQGIWAHSRAVALVARETAVMTRAADPEDAYLAGLLHDVGKPIVAGLLLEVEKAVLGRKTDNWMTANNWIEIIQRTHRGVGLAVGKKWQMPAAIQQALSGAAEYTPSADQRLANCVRLANLWTKQRGIYVGQVNEEEINMLLIEAVSLVGMDPKRLETLGQTVDQELKSEAA